MPESDETNNRMSVSLQVHKPDLVPISITPNGAAVAGQSLSVTWLARNQGDADAVTSGWYDILYFSTDNVLDGGDTQLSAVIDSSVTAGGDLSHTVSVTLPNVTVGTYYLILDVDAQSNLPETNESNNVLASALTLYQPTVTPTSTAASTPTDTAMQTPTASPTTTPTATAAPTSAVAICASTPRSDCVVPGKAALSIAADPSDPARRKLGWTWSLGNLDAAGIGDPILSGANYRLCIYDDAILKFSAGVAAGGMCDSKPCWSATATSRKYKSKNGNGDGIAGIGIKLDPLKGAIKIKGKGSLLASPFPIADTTAVRAQFVRNPGGPVACWEAVFPSPASTNDPSGKFKDELP